MILSDISIKRPVICLVASIIIVLIGVISFNRLPVREYPSTDSPIVSVRASYTGASAEVVESKVTEPLEKELSTIEGIDVIRSSSSEGRTRITIEFNLSRDIEEATNDVRDRVSRAAGQLPPEVENVQVEKSDADSETIMSVSFNSDRFNRLELTEIVDRIVVQRLQTVSGVGAVSLYGQTYAMRLWIDSDRMASYGLTITDIQNALRQQNVELPSGRIESLSREFPIRLQGRLESPAEYENVILATRGDYQVKLSDIGRVELGAADYRSESYFNGFPTAGVGIVRQSQANLLDVARGVKDLLPIIQSDLPEGISINISQDTSVFVERSVREVYNTLFMAAGLVVLMIFLFLRDWRATLIPMLAIPVSITGSFAIMHLLGFSINVLTLLALVLAVGLVVDDAIVMLENIYRRVEEGESPIHAAIFGARQVAFAIIATTLTLAAVFLPVAFQSGRTGRLFYEFGITLSVSVLVSSFVALTLTPMLCSRILKGRIIDGHAVHGWFYDRTEPFFVRLNDLYERMLRRVLRFPWTIMACTIAFSSTGFYLYTKLQRELTPQEDRGVFSLSFIPPVGASAEYNKIYTTELITKVHEIPELDRTFARAGTGRSFVFATLKPWEDRERTTQEITTELRRRLMAESTGGEVRVSAVRPFGGGRGGGGGSVSMVLQGADFDELQRIGDEIMVALRSSNVLIQPRIDPLPTKPQIDVSIDRARAADLGVPITDIAGTLETMLGGRRVTQFQRGNQQYDVLVQVEDNNRASPRDLARLYVKSNSGHLVQLSNLVTSVEGLVPDEYPHFNRLRAVTVSGQMAAGSTLGDGVAYLEQLVRPMLPPGYAYTWDGETREFVDSGNDTVMLFGLALLFAFLILAAQFESWTHPITIFSGVALALSGGLTVLYCTRFWGPPMTDNLFSRFGLIMLIGLVAKNGILIVEFANQLQVQGRKAFDAAFEAATLRFRPILMTSISTILGAVPIAFATGAGAETRNPMGLVIVGGLAISTFLTLFVIPVFYIMMDRAVMKVTGQSSAYGLKRAAEIEKEVSTGIDHGPGHRSPEVAQ